jgi:hypothetical protein
VIKNIERLLNSVSAKKGHASHLLRHAHRVSEQSSLGARLLISGPKSDSCSFMPWRGTAAATAGMCEGCAPKKFYARAFTQRIGAREWEMPPQGLRHKR